MGSGQQPGQVLTVALSSDLPAGVGLVLEPCPPRTVWDFSGAKVPTAGLPSPSLSYAPCSSVPPLEGGTGGRDRQRRGEKEQRSPSSVCLLL